MIVWNELTSILDGLTSIQGQVRQGREHDRTVRFYRLVPPAHTRTLEPDARVIELAGGWVLVYWLHAAKPITIYTSVGVCRQALADDGEYVLILDDVSERSRPADSRSSHTDTPLTSTERTVLRELRRGLSNKEIAIAVDRSVSTVKTIVSRIYAKLGDDIHDRIQAALLTMAWNLDEDDGKEAAE